MVEISDSEAIRLESLLQYLIDTAEHGLEPEGLSDMDLHADRAEELIRKIQSRRDDSD